jgi:integrase
MSLYKRGGTWWTDFSVNGQRFRLSLDTSDWREAQRQQKEKIANAQQGKIAPSSQQFSRLSFSQAADRFLVQRVVEISANTLSTESDQMKALKAFFGSKPVNRISADDVRSYQAHRHEEGRSNRTINHETGLLQRLLKRTRVWHQIASEVKRLPVSREFGRALTEEEKATLLKVAASRPEWQVIRCAAILAFNTTMRSGELKRLRWRDVDFTHRSITVRRSKTEAGRRSIPLNASAAEAILELNQRAGLIGNVDPEHYVFPACQFGKIDPTRPQKSWRSAWESLTTEAGLDGFRFHDLRHHAITELSESQVPDAVIMAIAGHVDRKMLEHYSHVRMEAKRRALEALPRTASTPENGHPEPKNASTAEDGYVTNHVTNATLEKSKNP